MDRSEISICLGRKATPGSRRFTKLTTEKLQNWSGKKAGVKIQVWKRWEFKVILSYLKHWSQPGLQETLYQKTKAKWNKRIRNKSGGFSSRWTRGTLEHLQGAWESQGAWGLRKSLWSPQYFWNNRKPNQNKKRAGLKGGCFKKVVSGNWKHRRGEGCGSGMGSDKGTHCSWVSSQPDGRGGPQARPLPCCRGGGWCGVWPSAASPKWSH